MPIKTKRWNDPRYKSDGFRLLVCRYRPRALPKDDETWDTWCPDLGPSRELHAAFYGKEGHEKIDWDEYRRRYQEEMKGEAQEAMIADLVQLVASGKTVTLLCSTACKKSSCCHRSLLRQIIEERVGPPAAGEAAPEPAVTGT